jgi:hypothetical protein
VETPESFFTPWHSLLGSGFAATAAWTFLLAYQRRDHAPEAIQRPDQMFDQYQALVLADRFITLPTTHNWAQERIAAAVRAQLESGALGTDANCRNAGEPAARPCALLVHRTDRM